MHTPPSAVVPAGWVACRGCEGVCGVWKDGKESNCGSGQSAVSMTCHSALLNTLTKPGKRKNLPTRERAGSLFLTGFRYSSFSYLLSLVLVLGKLGLCIAGEDPGAAVCVSVSQREAPHDLINSSRALTLGPWAQQKWPYIQTRRICGNKSAFQNIARQYFEQWRHVHYTWK